jgi:hypothetical protein
VVYFTGRITSTTDAYSTASGLVYSSAIVVVRCKGPPESIVVPPCCETLTISAWHSSHGEGTSLLYPLVYPEDSRLRPWFNDCSCYRAITEVLDATSHISYKPIRLNNSAPIILEQPLQAPLRNGKPIVEEIWAFYMPQPKLTCERAEMKIWVSLALNPWSEEVCILRSPGPLRPSMQFTIPDVQICVNLPGKLGATALCVLDRLSRSIAG